MPDLKVIWSEKARNTYSNIIDYLFFKWTSKEIHSFISRTEEIIDKISINPYLFKNNPSIRQAVIHPNVTLI